MPTSIEISPDGSVQGGGTIEYLVQNHGKEVSIPDVFREFIASIMRMAGFYKEKLKNDGRLFGSERFDLIEIIDEVITNGVLLRQIIDPEDRKFFTLANKGYGYNIFFQVIASRWECSGNLGNVKSINVDKFSVWMENRLSTNLKDLIEKVKEAYSDGVLTAQEKRVIESVLDKIIFGAVLVRKSILSGAMD